MGRPSLLLADEPTGNLDAATGSSILDLLHAIQEEDSLTLVMVTHDPAATARCSKVYRLDDGRIARTGED